MGLAWAWLAACVPPDGTASPVEDSPAEAWLAERGVEADLLRADLDERGLAHVRFQQRVRGVPVFGAQAVVHLDGDDVVRVTDRFVEPPLLDTVPRTHPPGAAASLWVLGDRLVWGVRGGVEGARTFAWVDARDGAVLASWDDTRALLDRQTSDAQSTLLLPGVLVRAEGDPPTGDAAVDDAHRNAGATWAYWRQRHGRDSWDGAGAPMASTVHLGQQLGLAFWDTDRALFGDGDGVYLRHLSAGTDVVAHELTHGLIEQTADLVYTGESGAVNEAVADVLGTAVEGFARGWVVDADTWWFGQDVVLPAQGDALRYLDDPTLDGTSIDHYGDWLAGMDVHAGSGVVNAAFARMVEDPALDLGDATDLFHDALLVEWTPTSDFADARRGLVQAATDRFGAGTAEVAAVEAAWDSVGVHAWTPFAVETPLQGLAGAELRFQYPVPAGQGWLSFRTTGGVGDADLFARFGAPPTTTVHDCASAHQGTEEHCEVDAPAGGTWHVLVRGFSAFAGVTLTSASAPLPNPVALEVCDDGLDDDADGLLDCDDPDCGAAPACAPLAGAAGDTRRLVVERPAGRSRMTFTLDGGAGNADLFVSGGALPTPRRADCASTGPGNQEICVFDPAVDGSYHLLIRGASAFGGAQLAILSEL